MKKSDADVSLDFIYAVSYDALHASYPTTWAPQFHVHILTDKPLIRSEVPAGGDTVLPQGVDHQRGGVGAAARIHGGGAAVTALAAPPPRRHQIRAASDGLRRQESAPPWSGWDLYPQWSTCVTWYRTSARHAIVNSRQRWLTAWLTDQSITKQSRTQTKECIRFQDNSGCKLS